MGIMLLSALIFVFTGMVGHMCGDVLTLRHKHRAMCYSLSKLSFGCAVLSMVGGGICVAVGMI